MCIIAVSRKGCRQPSLEEIRTMWENNPDGAGYMVARNHKVEIHKGFMVLDDFIRSIQNEHFTDKDSVVYHFRIATQGGINPGMTHPFPLTSDPSLCEALDLTCSIGVAHNGVIHLSGCNGARYSDTVYFITRYMTKLIRNRNDINDDFVRETIQYHLAIRSKFAIMDNAGNISMIGDFFESSKGLLYSNFSYQPKVVLPWHM